MSTDNVVALPTSRVRTAMGKMGGRLGGIFAPDGYEQEFLPAAVEVLETPPSPLGRAVALAISAFVGLALLWACVGEIDIVAVGQGKIVPSGRTKVIQAFETGVVTNIAVEEGQHVEKGALLIELDSTLTGADTDRLTQELTARRLDVARLRSVLGLPGGEALDDTRAAGGFDEANLALARSFRSTQLGEQEEKLAALARELERQRAGAVGTRAEIAKIEAQLPLKREQVEARRGLLEKGLTPKQQFLEMQQELIAMEGEASVAKARASEAQAGIATIQRQIAQATEEFERDRLKELTEAESQAAQLTEELKKATQRQALQRLTAPVAGTVQQLQLHTIGGVVEPAKPLMIVVPEDAGIEIEAEIENKDIGFVREGQEAIVKLDAFPFTRYGTLTGHVVTISGDAVEQQGGDGQPSRLIYTTRVRLEKDTIDADGRDVQLTPGMVAAVEIKTGTRKLIEYVLSPLIRMGDEAGRER
ncbi:HlyD family type I secretion periplasmic adaptor subunit [Dongia rigui]|uniref:Membrane fusion protein (MFP) family protein n=1 Tax=Dongia rigui TaxID=940149 RepID=A0ABU5DVK4_9PROT|nr:HlyD family type I secretion periplasmic adaptor subunit [Dongia rigui]MDY0870631.1 HlyD family type I secretion periplasmic adaptor subunit [Dongia rigui]